MQHVGFIRATGQDITSAARLSTGKVKVMRWVGLNFAPNGDTRCELFVERWRIGEQGSGVSVGPCRAESGQARGIFRAASSKKRRKFASYSEAAAAHRDLGGHAGRRSSRES